MYSQEARILLTLTFSFSFIVTVLMQHSALLGGALWGFRCCPGTQEAIELPELLAWSLMRRALWGLSFHLALGSPAPLLQGRLHHLLEGSTQAIPLPPVSLGSNGKPILPYVCVCPHGYFMQVLYFKTKTQNTDFYLLFVYKCNFIQRSLHLL